MDMNDFDKLYFESLSAYIGDLSSINKLINAVSASSNEMVQNVEYTTNEEVL